MICLDFLVGSYQRVFLGTLQCRQSAEHIRYDMDRGLITYQYPKFKGISSNDAFNCTSPLLSVGNFLRWISTNPLGKSMSNSNSQKGHKQGV